jgi:tRNA (guanine37-N1)-methyltransferase
MRIDVLTLFPEMFTGVFNASLLGRARAHGIVTLNTINFRAFAYNKHHKVDDEPYGGGGGMVLKPEPLFAAVEHVLHEAAAQRARQLAADSAGADPAPVKPPRIIMLSPQGRPFKQAIAQELSQESHLIFLCGHYEGFDERVREHLVTDELSLGDYVLTGGELGAMVIIDSVVRLLPGVLGNDNSAYTDSFSAGAGNLLEYPHYTRPAEFRSWQVPDILISGHHANVARWRREQSILRTLARRPELLAEAELTPAEIQWLEAQINDE